MNSLETSNNNTNTVVSLQSPSAQSQINHIKESSIGAVSGMFGRMSCNNGIKSAINLQSGNNAIDLKFSTTRKMLLGSTMQTAVIYGMKSFLQPEKKEGIEKFGSYFLCGAAGGVMLHPFNVNFFLDKKYNIAEIIKDPKQLIKLDKSIYFRGLPIRMIMIGIDWTFFFVVRDKFKNKDDGVGAKLLGASAAVAAISPLLPIYTRQVKTGESVLRAAKFVFGKETIKTATPSKKALSFAGMNGFNQFLIKNNKKISTAMILGFSVLDRFVIDTSKDLLTKSI
ncbi:MAG: hypothetical protein VX185_08870 [Pseudomonadota bacterium]|nr:hypothetical protein [Pseudomonadota bacterium]